MQNCRLHCIYTRKAPHATHATRARGSGRGGRGGRAKRSAAGHRGVQRPVHDAGPSERRLRRRVGRVSRLRGLRVRAGVAAVLLLRLHFERAADELPGAGGPHRRRPRGAAVQLELGHRLGRRAVAGDDARAGRQHRGAAGGRGAAAVAHWFWQPDAHVHGDCALRVDVL